MSQWTIDTIIWDFDGVVVDTGRDIANAMNYVLKTLGLEELPMPTIMSYIGGGAEPIVRKCLGDKSDALFDQALVLLKQRYGEYYLVETCLYPGVADVLEHYRAAGKQQAIATNKIERIARGILDGLHIAQYFSVLVGPESITHRKPHPEAVLRILEALQASPARALMVGDTAPDLLAGKAAGTITCGVTYGYGSREEVEGAGPDFIIDRAPEMLDYIV